MSNMNGPLPESKQAFVDERAERHGDREPIGIARNGRRMRALFLDAATSPVVAEMSPEYFDKLRARIRASTSA